MKYIDNRINANIVKLEDENNNYMSENVEGALEEIDSKIKTIEANGYDDTQIRQGINNIKNEIGSATLNTDAINIKGAINEVNSQIKDIENKVNREVNVLDFGADKTGVIDSSASIQAAIDYLNNKSDSGYKKNVGGVVVIPAGNFKIEKPILLKSNVKLKGDGIGTTNLFTPNNITFDSMFYTNVNTSLGENCVNLSFEDFSITDETFDRWGSKYGNGDNRPNINGFNLDHAFICSFKNVGVYNLKGYSLKLTQIMDSYFTDCEFQMCGTSTNPSIIMHSGVNDLTNAIHMCNCRIEKNGKIIIGDNIRPQRELYFIGCKFEGTDIEMNGVNVIKYSSCTFTQNEVEGYMIKFLESDIGNSLIKFSNCDFQSGYPNTGLGIDLSNSELVSINNCNFDLMLNSIKDIKNNSILATISNCNFKRCNTPCIEVNNCSKINNNNFLYISGSDYTIKTNNDCNILNNFLHSCVNSTEKGIYFNESNKVENNRIDSGFQNHLTMNGNGNMIIDNNSNLPQGDYVNNIVQKNMNTSISTWGESKQGVIKIDTNNKCLAINLDGTGFKYVNITNYGSTDQRPKNLPDMQFYFDTTINKLIIWVGNVWMDTMGNIV